MHRWSAPGGEDDVKEFLIQDNVSLSFEIERVKRSHFERLRQHIENADDAELEAVRDLGSRLYFDCTGPTSTYGTRKWDSKKDRASWQKEAVQPDDPGELVKKLLSSAHGCYWLLEQWDFLKDRLHTGRGHWVPSDKFRAIRLISKQPIDAVDCKTVAQIFTASHALYQAGKPFDNLISDMGEAALDTYVKRVTSLYRDLIGAEDPKKARQFLIELVEENIREIEVVLEEHLEKDREKAQRTIDHHGFNDTRDGEAIRRHWLRCRNALVRGTKMNESRRGTPRRDGDGTGLSDPHPPRPPLCKVGRGGAGLRLGRGDMISGDGGADGTRNVPATGNNGTGLETRAHAHLGGEGDAGFAVRPSSPQADRTATVVEIHAADVLACSGFLPERVAPRAVAAQKLETRSSKLEIAGAGLGEEALGNAAANGVTGEELRTGAFGLVGEQSAGEHDATTGTANATGTGDDLTSAHEGPIRGNVTNEANLDDDVRILQTREIVDVTADSGDGLGLDNLRTKPNSTMVKGGNGGAVVRVSAVGDLGLAAAAGGPGSFGPRERDLLKMERTIHREIESLKAQGEPARELLNEMLAASAELHAYLEQQQQQPRAP